MRLPTKLALIFVNQSFVISEEKVMDFLFSNRLKKTNRVKTMAENNDVKIPMIKVVAKPRIAPLPKLYRTNAVSKVVMLASMIALYAFW